MAQRKHMVLLRHSSLRQIAIVTLVAITASGCAVDRQTVVIPATDLPFNLGATSGPLDGGKSSKSAQPSIFFVAPTGLLEPQMVSASSDRPDEVIPVVLDRLAGGPTPIQSSRGLRTSLPASVTLRLVALSEGTATISVNVETNEPVDAVRAVGQIVLSAVSVPGVDRVLLTSPSGPLEAPVPEGPRTLEPLTAKNFDTLISRRDGAGDLVQPGKPK